MPKPFSLGRTRQCAGCPWKLSVDPADIPNGFCERSHERIGESTAWPGHDIPVGTPITIMQCHDSPEDKPQHCAGWVHNQLVQNNIPLRIKLMDCTNIRDLQVDGAQRRYYTDVIPL